MRLLASMLLFSALACAGPLEIRIVFDNTVADNRCEKFWGFAAFVAMDNHRLLFDAGGKADIFMRNLDALGIDPTSFDTVVISHRHDDHTAGLAPLQQQNPRLKILWPDPPEPYQVPPGIYSTSVIHGVADEQALVIETAKGLVIITGCSHPGVVKMVQAAVDQRKAKEVRLLIGGFHMLNYKPEQITETITQLKKLNVRRMAATHCTGDRAISMFREAYGDDFQPAGAGRVIVLE